VAAFVTNDPDAGEDETLEPPAVRQGVWLKRYVALDLGVETYYTPQAAHLPTSAPRGVKASLMTDCLKKGSMLVASDHATAANRISRARYASPRRVSRTNISAGMAALISFRDLCTKKNERVLRWRVRKGSVPWHRSVCRKRIFRVLLNGGFSPHFESNLKNLAGEVEVEE
jgi:hypothetical protein